MTSDIYTKFVLTVIAISSTVIAIQLSLPEAHAQRVDSESGMVMFRLCERTAGKVNCADVTNDFALKVKVVN